MSIIQHLDLVTRRRLYREIQSRIGKVGETEREKEEAEAHLLPFIRLMWPFVEPSRKLIEGWPLEALCLHLEAVSAGQITRLLINIPPGYMKSLICNVFWPAWEWIKKPSLRYIGASYSQSLTVRDNTRFRQVVTSDVYRKHWGEKFGWANQKNPNVIKIENDKTGWKLATSVGGVGTGERGDRFVIDDGNSIKEAESTAVTASTNQWFREVVPTRLNDARTGVIINIQQRTNELDISGIILDPENGMTDDYTHLMIPMEYDPTRHCVTVLARNAAGEPTAIWQDPRGADPEVRDANEGALAWPARFPRDTVEREKRTLQEYATAGQFQQMPVPRGGGIFKRDDWREWPPVDWPERASNDKVNYPPLEFVVASLDTALSEKQTADYSALTIWAIWRSTGKKRIAPRVSDDGASVMRLDDDRRAKCMLLHGWEKRLKLHGPNEERPVELSDVEWNAPRMLSKRQEKWGLVEWTVFHCRKFRVDTLLIESKSNGIDVANELQRLHSGEDWGTILVDPGAYDKVSRAYSLEHLWQNGIIYAPLLYKIEDDRWGHPEWCTKIMDQFTIFPRGKHDDLVDSSMHALKYMRDLGLLLRTDEEDRSHAAEFAYPSRSMPLYPA